MNFEIFFYSIIQGITEFLPISSSAHLYFFEELFSWKEVGVVYALAAHLGTLLAVLLYQKKEIFLILYDDCIKNKNPAFIKVIIISVLPTLFLGILIVIKFKQFYTFNLVYIGLASILGAVFLGYSDRKEITKTNLQNLNMKSSLFVGVFQILALIPGMSRSGTVITAMRLLGYRRKEAILFSLFSGIPIILSACVYGIYSVLKFEIGINYNFLLISICSFLSAYFSISLIINWIKKFSFKIFVIYRIFFGFFLLLYFFS